MRILVTGGAGFIGSHLVDALLGEEHQVIVVDDLSRGKEKNVNPKAKLYNVNVCSESLADIFGHEKPEIVFHHAARTSVNHSMLDPIDDARVNVLGSLNVLQNSVKMKVKQVIYASTGGALYGNPEYLPCDEDHPINPLSPYGSSKHAVEHYLKLYRLNWGLEYSVLRYPNVYGPRQDPFGEAGVVAIFANRMTRGEVVYINGSGLQERDFLYVRDVVRANLAIIGRGDGCTYNLGSGGAVSIVDLFGIMKDLSNYNQAPIFRQALSGEVFKIYLDAGHIKEDLGWRPETTLKEGLSQTIKYQKNLKP